MLSSARAISHTVQPSHLLCEEADVFMNLKIKGIMGHVQCSFLEFFWLGFYAISSRRGKESKREETNVTAQAQLLLMRGPAFLCWDLRMCENQVIMLSDKTQVSPYASILKIDLNVYILIDLLVVVLSLMTVSWSQNFVGLTNLKTM